MRSWLIQLEQNQGVSSFHILCWVMFSHAVWNHSSHRSQHIISPLSISWHLQYTCRVSLLRMDFLHRWCLVGKGCMLSFCKQSCKCWRIDDFKYFSSSGFCPQQRATAFAMANTPQSDEFDCFCKLKVDYYNESLIRVIKLTWILMCSISIELSRANISEAICCFVESGRWVLRLSYTRTTGCVVVTMLMVTQWFPPECKIWTLLSVAISNVSICPRTGFCREPTGSKLLPFFKSSCAACMILSVSHLPLKILFLSSIVSLTSPISFQNPSSPWSLLSSLLITSGFSDGRFSKCLNLLYSLQYFLLRIIGVFVLPGKNCKKALRCYSVW